MYDKEGPPQKIKKNIAEGVSPYPKKLHVCCSHNNLKPIEQKSCQFFISVKKGMGKKLLFKSKQRLYWMRFKWKTEIISNILW